MMVQMQVLSSEVLSLHQQSLFHLWWQKCLFQSLGAIAELELVDKFCYLGDMLSVDGDADAAVEARIRIG